jgi:hypothetical protein
VRRDRGAAAFDPERPLMDAVLATHVATRDAAFLTQHGAENPAAVAYLEETLRDRAARYAAHVAAMDLTPDVVQWALAMRAKWQSPYVQVHRFIADWLTALLIVRYGEECDPARCTPCTLASGEPASLGWPAAFSEADLARAAELLAGVKWPASLTLLPPVVAAATPAEG